MTAISRGDTIRLGFSIRLREDWLRWSIMILVVAVGSAALLGLAVGIWFIKPYYFWGVSARVLGDLACLAYAMALAARVLSQGRLMASGMLKIASGLMFLGGCCFWLVFLDCEPRMLGLTSIKLTTLMGSAMIYLSVGEVASWFFTPRPQR